MCVHPWLCRKKAFSLHIGLVITEKEKKKKKKEEEKASVLLLFGSA